MSPEMRRDLANFLHERLGFSVDADSYWDGLQKMGAFVYHNMKGFMIFHTNGDAVIVRDIYIKPEYRDKGNALHYLHKLLEIAVTLKKNVIIGINTLSGNLSDGRNVMTAGGFKKYLETPEFEFFIRGTQPYEKIPYIREAC